jgi:hypothetical protein
VFVRTTVAGAILVVLSHFEKENCLRFPVMNSI